MRPIALDFETQVIDGHVPPKPVGFASAVTQRRGFYHAFGHPSGNVCTERAAKGRLRQAAAEFDELWFFNAGFDVPVAHRWGVPIPWAQVRDAQILAFLGNPLAPARGLKALCESELGIPATERDDLHRWIRAEIPEARRLKDTRKLGTFIARAPGDLVAPYASRDVTDVLALRAHWRSLARGPAWSREHAMLPILDAMRQRGVPIARRRLARDAVVWEGWLARCEVWLKARLGLRDLKPRLVVAACEAAGIVDEWIETPEGGVSLAAESLARLVVEGKFRDPQLVAVWGYHAYLGWLLRTFVRHWLAGGEDFVHPTWNGVLQERGGAVTGRLSSRPNVQNLPKRVPTFDVPEDVGVGPLPNLRAYVEAPAGFRFVGVDVSQQELRILGHFVPGIGDLYRKDAKLDLHVYAMRLMADASGMQLVRDVGKATNLTTIYGGGARILSERLGISETQARLFKRLHADAFPGIARLRWEMARDGRYATAGGRWYTSVDGKEYRDINYRIQGSAGDQLKECMIAAHGVATTLGGWLPLTAHDELLACVPRERAAEMRRELTAIVESTGLGGSREMFDVPMLGETYEGKRWVKH